MDTRSMAAIRALLLEEKVFVGNPAKYDELRRLSSQHFCHCLGSEWASEQAWFYAVVDMLQKSGFQISQASPGEGKILQFKVHSLGEGK